MVDATNAGTLVPAAALVVQAGLAVLLVIRSRALPRPDTGLRPTAPAVLTPLAAALAAILPLTLLAVRIPAVATGPPALAITVPIWLGAALAGVIVATPDPASVRSPRSASASGHALPAGAVPFVAGVLLLLLAAAHDLPRLTGQLFFAVAAVALWMASGPAPSVEVDEDAGRVARLVTIALALGAAGAVALPRFPVGATAVNVVAAVGAGSILIGRLPRSARMTAACYIAGLGPVLAIGILGVSRLLPEVVDLARGRAPMPTHVVFAHGFGRFALDGLLLIAVALLALMMPGRQRTAIAGAALGGAVLAVVVLRWTGLG